MALVNGNCPLPIQRDQETYKEEQKAEAVSLDKFLTNLLGVTTK